MPLSFFKIIELFDELLINKLLKFCFNNHISYCEKLAGQERMETFL